MSGPEWEQWRQVTMVAAIFFIIAGFVVTIAACYLIVVLADLRRNVNAISERIKRLTDRVDGIAKTVQEVTTEVGSRTSGIVRTVDDIAGAAFNVVERFAPYVIGAAVLFKLKKLFDSRQ